MANLHAGDEYKERFRPDSDPGLDKEVEAALADVPVEELYAFDKPRPEAAAGQAAGQPDGTRRGKVVSIGRDDVFIDLGGKSQGICSLMQFDTVKIGEEFDFTVDRYDEREGLLILNRKGVVSSNVSWDNMEVGQIVEGTVTGMNKGGLEVEIKGMRAFMPAGQVDLYFQKDISTLIGQRVTVEVTQFDRHAKNLIVSRRVVLEREKEEARQKLMAELAEGQTRRGVVRSVMDYGAFVDLGGVDGLLHVSEMSHRRGRHPSEFVKVDDLVDVKIVKIDKETGKLSLSLKQAMPDPWANVETRYPVGTSLTGRVTRVEAFGAFVEVEEGLEGLLPVSEMSWQRIRHPSDVVKDGDTIKLVVISLDSNAKRMSFSLKQAGPDPWAQVKERYAIDMVVPGKVTRVVDFGAFVELEPGLEGLVHISELAPNRVRAASDVVKPGQEVQVRVLEIDKDARRISLSIRRAAEAPAPAPVAAPEPPGKKKKRPELRGGLDWNW
ncbi:MAG TPA: S1 RNA-binding domain-containing protein [Tepidisphaeraceae bacterium]|nr:S1 RNA-binding domain-containing protein [Tepidisphaeraceae bacterium]